MTAHHDKSVIALNGSYVNPIDEPPQNGRYIWSGVLVGVKSMSLNFPLSM